MGPGKEKKDTAGASVFLAYVEEEEEGYKGMHVFGRPPSLGASLLLLLLLSSFSPSVSAGSPQC